MAVFRVAASRVSDGKFELHLVEMLVLYWTWTTCEPHKGILEQMDEMETVETKQLQNASCF